MQSVSFWEAFGGDVKKSEVKTLTLAGAPFEEVCEQPTFIDEFLALNDYVVNYLASDANVEKMVNYLVDMTEYKSAQYTKKCHYPYFAFIILSTNNTKVFEKLFGRPPLVQKLFAVGLQDPEVYVTSQGYLAAMFKNWISPQNSNPGPFIQFLHDNFATCILPLTQNLSTSNADIFKEILTCRNDGLDKQQSALFQYLIYYHLSEKFDANFLVRNPDTFENIYSIFRYLTEVKISYPYQREYIPKLWTNLHVQFEGAREDLLILRVQVLKFLALTNQIAVFPADKSIYGVTKTFKNQHKIRYFLRTFLEFLAILTKNPNSISVQSQPLLFSFLLDVLSAGNLDVILSKIFAIMDNCLPWILGNPEIRTRFFQFLSQALTQQSQLQSSSYKPNSPYISMHFLSKLISKVDPKDVPSQFGGINDWRKKLDERYKKLAFDNLDGDSILTKKNSIKFDINQDIEFFTDADGTHSAGNSQLSSIGSSPSQAFRKNDSDKLQKAFETTMPAGPGLPANSNDPFAAFK